MVKKKVKYINFNGEEKEQTLYFNLNEVEAVRLQASLGGQTLDDYVLGLDPENDPGEVMNFFEKLLSMSYGQRDEDGEFFDKSEDIRARFLNSAAYSSLFMEFLQDTDSAADFFNRVVAPTRLPDPGAENE